MNDVCQEFDQFTLDNVDSRWAILIAENCDGQIWLDYLENLVYKNQILCFEKNDILGGDDLRIWAKDFLYLLNDNGIFIHQAPQPNTPDQFSGVIHEENNSTFFTFIQKIFYRISEQQKIALSIFPPSIKKNTNYL